MLGVFIHSLPYAPTWSFLRLSMITTTTLGSVSLLSRGPQLEARAEAPSRDPPATPAPATFRNSFRVSALCTAPSLYGKMTRNVLAAGHSIQALPAHLAGGRSTPNVLRA